MYGGWMLARMSRFVLGALIFVLCFWNFGPLTKNKVPSTKPKLAIIRAVAKRHKQRHKLMIVAGEPSGDAHAAALVKALREHGEFDLFGATGPLMRDAGVETIVNSDELAIMGIVEVGRVFQKFIKAFRKLKAAAIEQSPDAVVLVDWPEFNLRLASSLHRRDLKVIYYISPQLWAWRPRRIRNIKRDVDLLLSRRGPRRIRRTSIIRRG